MKPRIAKTGAVFWACSDGLVRGVARSPGEAYKVWFDNVVQEARYRIAHAERKLACGLVGTP